MGVFSASIELLELKNSFPDKAELLVCTGFQTILKLELFC